MLVDGCLIVNRENSCVEHKFTRVVRRNTLTSLPTVALSAETVRGFAVTGAAAVDFRLSVRGSRACFSTALPIDTLPPYMNIADVFLDLGSTTTKWAVRLPGREPVTRDQETASLTDTLGVGAYQKSELIKDPTGASWVDWVARALPALRRWVGSEHNAYLHNVHLALPATKEFDVCQLAELLDKVSSRIASPAMKPLSVAMQDHLVCGGRVFLVPEHDLVAHHYLSVLRTLQTAAKDYGTRFNSIEARRADQLRRQSDWDRKQASVSAFDRSSWWNRLWNTRPPSPDGSRPWIGTSIASPAAWINDLIDRPEQFDRVVILDAGGLSLDVSVINKTGLVRGLSTSFSGCGGEDISGAIGRKEKGERGTKYKASLGKTWEESRDLSDRRQLQYREATRDIYHRDLDPVFSSLQQRWKRGQNCSVLLTGGGARNPHFRDFVQELAQKKDLAAWVVDARGVQDLIDLARRFPEPLPGLESDEIRRFEAAQAWSDNRSRQPGARYDKYAVVGGMMASENGRL